MASKTRDETASEETSSRLPEPHTTWWEDLRDHYFSFDRRTLGMSRIFIGLYLIFDLLRRTTDWWKMYSNDGVLPTHYNLWRPQSGGWSFFNAFAERSELWALWALGLVIYTGYILGWKTKVWQVAAAIYVASMNGRVLLIENGGYVVQNLLMLWTAFLPLGDRFSLDSVAASMKTQKERSATDLNDRRLDVAHWRLEPFVSFAGLALILQLGAIYYFNVVHKTGPNWKNGTAVHYVIYVDRMVNPLFAHVREFQPWWVEMFLTKTVLAAEAGLPVALLSPLARVWAKRLVIVFINFLHIGFGSVFTLGPFAWALCCFSTLLISTEDWELVIRTMKRPHRRRTVRYEARSAWAFFWCRLLKRWDHFELLTFEADARAQGLEVTLPDGSRKTGVDATLDIVSALPGGPALAFPWRLPLLKQLFGAFGMLWRPVGHFLGFDRRKEPKKAQPVGYQPELKDDVGYPTIDGAFMERWLEKYYEGRRFGYRQFYLSIGVTFLGAFTFVYAAAMLQRKLKWRVQDDFYVVLSTQARELFDMSFLEGAELGMTFRDVSFYVGVVIFLAGLFFLLRPFVVMNWTEPAPPARKWIRVRAGFREAFCMVMFAGAMNQALVELWVARPLNLPQPDIPRTLAHKLRYLQGWFMFSPNPVMDDGTIIVDAITVDGRRVDPFSVDTYDKRLGPPRYDLLNAKSFAYNQIWSDYFNRMHMSGNTAYRKPMKEYMYRLPERTGNPNDAIVKGVVYWVHDMNPKWGTTNSYGYGAKELFKFSNPDREVQNRFRELTGGKDPEEIPLPTAQPSPDS